MGFYTDLDLDVVLHNLSENDLQCLNAMLECNKDFKATGHPLFDTERWLRMFGCPQHRTLDGKIDRDATLTRMPDATYKLHVRSCFKNYDDEIAKLLDFLSPHVHASNSDLVGRTLTEDYHKGVILRDCRSNILAWCPAGRDADMFLEHSEQRLRWI